MRSCSSATTTRRCSRQRLSGDAEAPHRRELRPPGELGVGADPGGDRPGASACRRRGAPEPEQQPSRTRARCIGGCLGKRCGGDRRRGSGKRLRLDRGPRAADPRPRTSRIRRSARAASGRKKGRRLPASSRRRSEELLLGAFDSLGSFGLGSIDRGTGGSASSGTGSSASGGTSLFGGVGRRGRGGGRSSTVSLGRFGRGGSGSRGVGLGRLGRRQRRRGLGPRRVQQQERRPGPALPLSCRKQQRPGQSSKRSAASCSCQSLVESGEFRKPESG